MTSKSILSRGNSRPAELQLALACLSIAAGGLLLGLAVDGNGDLVGTGYTSLGIGAIVALVASLVQLGTAGRVPRDPLSAWAAVMGFLGLAFLVSGVLAPGGPWMFGEVLLLLWLLARRHRRVQAGGPEIGAGSLFLLTLMLLLRLWIAWQGSRHQWALVEIELPVLAWLPFDWLEPIRTVELGAFTPQEMGFPPTGIDFALSTSLWAAGFAFTAAGLWLKGEAAREHECDRIDALIQTLPPPAAAVVERLVPEDEWEALGLFGLPERRLARRLEALVAERVREHRRLELALERTRVALPATATGGAFTHAVTLALAAAESYDPAAAGEGVPPLTTAASVRAAVAEPDPREQERP